MVPHGVNRLILRPVMTKLALNENPSGRERLEYFELDGKQSAGSDGRFVARALIHGEHSFLSSSSCGTVGRTGLGYFQDVQYSVGQNGIVFVRPTFDPMLTPHHHDL